MKFFYRAMWLAVAFCGGVSFIGVFSAVLRSTKTKYVEV